MHKDARHTQRIGNQASMLATGTAEALQRVARYVVAACNRDLLNGVGHLLHGDADEAFGHIFGSAAGLSRKHPKFVANDSCVERLVCRRAKHLGKVARHDLAEQNVGVGHRQRATASVTRRSRIRPRALRPDAKA